jgi:hypothetical protein
MSPALARRYSFPIAGAVAIEAATRIIDNTVSIEADNFTPEQFEQVVRHAVVNDKVRPRYQVGVNRITRQVAVIPDCVVLGHVGAVARASDGALLFPRAGELPNWNYARPKRLRVREFGDGLVTALKDTQHYYHFFERLLGLLSYLDRDHEPGTPLTVIVRANGPAFQKGVCKTVETAYPHVRFVELARDERAEIRSYLWLNELSDNTEWLPVDRERAARLAGLLRGHYRQPEPKGGELLFFSRGQAKARRLINEVELQTIAARLGFRRFEAVSGNHPEQVRRFGEADVIVAVHGAGLTNLLFARPGASVIELFPADCVKSTYLYLANRLNLHHCALLGSPGDYHQAFSVEAGAFEAKLADVLAERAKRNPMLYETVPAKAMT